MKHYVAHVSTASYEDDWEEGQIGEVTYIDFADSPKFGTLKEAVEWFLKQYRRDVADCEPELVDTGTLEDSYITCPRPMQKPTQYGFRNATDEEFEAWKRCEITLWSLEYQLRVAIVEDVPSDELKEAFDEAGKKF